MPHLDVTVIGCRGIPGEWTERVDPYVVVHYGRQKETTRTDREGGRNPNFNQTLRFNLDDSPAVLEIVVKDNDPIKDDKLTEGVVEFHEALTSGYQRGTYPFKRHLLGGTGEIELEIRVTQ